MDKFYTAKTNFPVYLAQIGICIFFESAVTIVYTQPQDTNLLTDVNLLTLHSEN